MRKSSNVKQEVLILTDGESNCDSDVVQAAEDLRVVADVCVLVIGRRSDAGMDELKSYVSAPRDEHLFAIEGYQDLEKLLDLVEDSIHLITCAHFDMPN